MATKKPQQSLADYVTIALSPLLIMALVGSLVFFLLEILYAGQFPERLKWTLFFFVFGMVLVARIAIEIGSERAGLYGLLLGGAVFLALQAFIEYPAGSPLAMIGWAINLGLILLIWWCVSRLTWDCTHIDDAVDASGTGVLQAAGLDEPAGLAAQQSPADEGEPDPDQDQPGLLGWWGRYRRYRAAQRRKPHTPGVWVVYFSLAALPLFGLGQSLIPADEEDRRRYAFWLMVCYVGSGLGLLLTTSFLGLRRYLRQRKLKMPAAMTGVWLALGGGLIVVLMVVGALLPRPYGEYQLVDFSRLGSKERDASRYAVNRDSTGKGEGRPSSDPERDDPEAKGGSGAKSGNEGQGKSGNKSSGGQGGKSGSGSGKQGDKGSGKTQGKSGDQSSSKGEPRSDDKQDQQSDNRDNDKARDPNDQKAEDRRDEQKNGRGDSRSSGAAPSQKKAERSRSGGGGRSSSSNPILGFMSKLGWLATALKWIVFGVLLLVVVFFVFRSGLRFLANFTAWARRLLDALRAWWQGLFGGKDEGPAEAEEDRRAQVKRPRPFASFRNPFQDGSAGQLSPDELARYTFEALEAWAWERGLGRQPEETPLEFADRLGADVPALEAGARRVAGLYARSAYGRGRLTAGVLGVLQEFWGQLETVHEKPLSA